MFVSIEFTYNKIIEISNCIPIILLLFYYIFDTYSLMHSSIGILVSHS